MLFTDDDFTKLSSYDDMQLAAELANNIFERHIRMSKVYYGRYLSNKGYIGDWSLNKKVGDTHSMRSVCITEIPEYERL